jgi:hypothetical protein
VEIRKKLTVKKYKSQKLSLAKYLGRLSMEKTNR